MHLRHRWSIRYFQFPQRRLLLHAHQRLNTGETQEREAMSSCPRIQPRQMNMRAQRRLRAAMLSPDILSESESEERPVLDPRQPQDSFLCSTSPQSVAPDAPPTCPLAIQLRAATALMPCSCIVIVYALDVIHVCVCVCVCVCLCRWHCTSLPSPSLSPLPHSALLSLSLSLSLFLPLASQCNIETTVEPDL